MTASPHTIDPQAFLEDSLAQASPDLLRNLMQMVVNALLSGQADAICGADYRARTDERANRRNGYRHRDLAPPQAGGTPTRVGTLDVAIPKLRQGTFFPEWLLERRKRAEAALTTVVANLGVPPL